MTTRRPTTNVTCSSCHKRLARVRVLIVPIWRLEPGVHGKRIGGKEAILICPGCQTSNRYDLKGEVG